MLSFFWLHLKNNIDYGGDKEAINKFTYHISLLDTFSSNESDAATRFDRDDFNDDDDDDDDDDEDDDDGDDKN